MPQRRPQEFLPQKYKYIYSRCTDFQKYHLTNYSQIFIDISAEATLFLYICSQIAHFMANLLNYIIPLILFCGTPALIM